MKKILYFLMLSALTFNSQAQLEEVETIADELDTSNKNDNQYNKTPKNIRYNNKYSTSIIVGDYVYFYLKNSSYRDKKYGIAKNGKVILPMIFSYKSYENYDGRIILGVNSNNGLYNVYTGVWDIPMMYEKINSLGQNLFSVKSNGKYGVVDENNEIIVPFDWKEIIKVRGLENYIRVSKNDYPNTVYGIYSIIEGKVTVPCIYSSVKMINNQNSFLIRDSENKMNIIDINNKKYFKEDYEQIYLSKNGRNYFIVKKNGLMGIINQDEEIIVPIEYLSISNYPYSDGSYLAQNKEGKYGCMLIDGTITLPFEYEGFKKQGGNNVVTIKNGKCGIVQLNSGIPFEIVTCDYDDLQKTNEVFIVEKKNKFGLLNAFGKIVVPIEYTEITPISTGYSNKGLFRCKKNNRYFLINSLGNILTEDNFTEMKMVPRKENNYYNNSSYAFIKVKTKNQKYGLIDKTGRTIVEPIFDDVISDSKNMLIVKINGKYGIYSVFKKKLVLPAEFDLLIKNNMEYIGNKNNQFYIIKFVSGEIKVTSAIVE